VAFSLAWSEAEVEHGAGGDQALDLVAAFRGELNRCLSAWRMPRIGSIPR
jgi:hypothetical protein